jgi:hypothetical protein
MPQQKPGAAIDTKDRRTEDPAATLDAVLSAWREKLQQLAELHAQAGSLVAHELESAVESARRTARQRLAEELNQKVRRLRQAHSSEEVSEWLLEASSPFSARAAMLSVYGDSLQGLRLRGVEAEPARQLFEAMDLLVHSAAAFAHCVGQKEPVTAMARASEVSAELMEVFRHEAGDLVHLFPVVVHGEVAAVLYAAGAEPADAAALEMLTGIAGTMTETLVSDPLPPVLPEPALVQIHGAGEKPGEIRPPEWSTLGKQEQELHLLARRFARVQVAEIRLYQPARVEKGRSLRRLYAELRPEIDETRETFRQKFMLASPTMVDYFHLELLRSLAHDNVAVLGRDYPGPLEQRPRG